jgi:hypothetical protein
MFATFTESLRDGAQGTVEATADCTRQCARATERLIRREPTKALIAAATIGALVEIGIYAIQHRRKPAPPVKNWRSSVVAAFEPLKSIKPLRRRRRSGLSRLWS